MFKDLDATLIFSCDYDFSVFNNIFKANIATLFLYYF